MNVKGIQKTSLIDFPGVISSVLFTGGCNLRCGYCYNELLTDDTSLDSHTEESVFSFLKKRKGLIDGVVISGGEPTLQKDLKPFIIKVRELGFRVKIDTNGMNPDVIRDILSESLVDYIAMDIKTSAPKYEELCGKGADYSRILETLEVMKKSGIDYELRTTCVPDFVTFEDLKMIASDIKKVKRYYLQQFVNESTIDKNLSARIPYEKETLAGFRSYMSDYAEICEIRGI